MRFHLHRYRDDPRQPSLVCWSDLVTCPWRYQVCRCGKHRVRYVDPATPRLLSPRIPVTGPPPLFRKGRDAEA